jgi:hypothetical protein
MPMQRVVGGVEIENDLLGRPPMRLHKQIDKQPRDRRLVPGDPVIARRYGSAVLQAVQRRFAGQRRAIPAARCQLASQHRQRRIVAQFVMIEQILITQRQREDPLPDQSGERVLDQLRRPMVAKAPGKALDQPDRPVGRTEQQGAGVRGDRAAIERDDHRAPLDACKSEQIRATLCRHRGSPWS